MPLAGFQVQTMTNAATLSVPTGVKTVTYYLDTNTSGFVEYSSPYFYRGDNAQVVLAAGTHTLKQSVVFTDGSVENLLVTFTVK